MTDLLTRIEKNQPVEAQELYDYIVEAIVKQGRPSVGDNDRCLYRGPDGLKCAAGHVIPDSMYSEEMEGNAVDSLALQTLPFLSKPALPKSLHPHQKLLTYLQSNHDAAAHDNDFMGSFLSYSNTLAKMLSVKPYGDKA
jgi:hypothetical protein